jgi:hypothetical protein
MRLLPAAFALVLAAPAAAQSPPPICMAVDEMETILRRHGETPLLRALMDSGNTLVIFASAQGGWTAVIVAPTGAACVGGMGVALKMLGRGA